jgi:outer membrane protein
MDLFISLGKTGYSRSFGGSVARMPGDAYDAEAALSFELPVGNRLARARQRRAVLTRSQLAESLQNVEDLVREDVEAAFIEVGRALQQVDATAATRRLQEEKLRAETAKFRVGKSTALLVAATQSDLVTSQVAEVAAVTTYLKALTDLYLLEGSLLERRGIVAPGALPAEGD